MVFRTCRHKESCFFQDTCLHAQEHPDRKSCLSGKEVLCPYGIKKHLLKRCKITRETKER
jgi:hypothetical protein